LQHGANPNTRSNQKTGVVAHATAALAQAQKEGNDLLHARIYSCLTLLIDHGGRAAVSVYDEYTLPDRSPGKGKQPFGRRPLMRRLRTPLHTTEDNSGHQLHSECIQPSKLADTQFDLSEKSAKELVGPELEDPECPLPLPPLPLLFPMSEMRADSHHRPKKPKLDSRSEFTSMRNHEILRSLLSPLIAAIRAIRRSKKELRIFIKLHFD
jgi:hypothetical protein